MQRTQISLSTLRTGRSDYPMRDGAFVCAGYLCVKDCQPKSVILSHLNRETATPRIL